MKCNNCETEMKRYFEFVNSDDSSYNKRETGINVLSLFANIGVAEAYLKKIGVNVVIANELIERRAILYSKIYPETHMICGDITNEKIFKKIVDESIDRGVNIIMATPPCQGMSTVGQKVVDDERNRLVCQVIDSIKEIKPKYALIENVPMFFNTKIIVGENEILIPELLDKELGKDYVINKFLIDTKDYSVPQSRERAIVLMTRKGQAKEWVIPEKNKKVYTMEWENSF